jgi:uncharacterized damage-inducible protein DinB
MINEYGKLIEEIFQGWEVYHNALMETIAELSPDQLNLQPDPDLRSIGTITSHIISARARWFYLVMGEGGASFKSMGNWDRRGARLRSAVELVEGLKKTWEGMQDAIASWSAEQWEDSWPGEYEGEPKTITRTWVIWHLIEHDLHHGGEISIILGANGIPGIKI